MDDLRFAILFALIHAASYTLAGALALSFSRDVYRGEQRLMDYLRDMSDSKESRVVQKRFLPVQLLRGLLMGVVMCPLLGALAELTFIVRFVFFAALMFVFTDLASASPAPGNLEGYVYMRSDYLRRPLFAKMQVEMLIYSLLFGAAVSWLLF